MHSALASFDIVRQHIEAHKSDVRTTATAPAGSLETASGPNKQQLVTHLTLDTNHALHQAQPTDAANDDGGGVQELMRVYSCSVCDMIYQFYRSTHV